jgi:predicted transcriptional regulator
MQRLYEVPRKQATMPPRTHPQRPTDAELEILQVLWQRGTSTVRQVYDVLSEKRDLAYTTVLKMLQIMHEKGLVVRDETDRSHSYSAARPQAEVQEFLVTDLVERAFGGSAEKLFMSAIGSTSASPEELTRIRALLDEARAKRKPKG